MTTGARSGGGHISNRCGDTSQGADSYHEPRSFHMHQHTSQYLLLAPDTETDGFHTFPFLYWEEWNFEQDRTHTRRIWYSCINHQSLTTYVIISKRNVAISCYPPLSSVSGCVSGECRRCCMLALSFPPPGDKTVTTRHPPRSRYTIYSIYSAPYSADCDWFPLKLNTIDCMSLAVRAVGCDLHQTRAHCLIITLVSCGFYSWRVTDRGAGTCAANI